MSTRSVTERMAEWVVTVPADDLPEAGVERVRVISENEHSE